MKERRFTYEEIQNGGPDPKFYVETELVKAGFDFNRTIHCYQEGGQMVYRQGDKPKNLRKKYPCTPLFPYLIDITKHWVR